MSKLMPVIRTLLEKVLSDIDAGNSNLSERECEEVIEVLKRYTYKDEGMSKYSACRYLGISRATFDNYVREGRLPKGKHVLGFKEKRWFKKDLVISD